MIVKHMKILEKLLSKQQAFDADPRAIHQINFTANLYRAGTNDVFHYWRSKRNCLRLFARNCKNIVDVLWNSLIFIDIK